MTEYTETTEESSVPKSSTKKPKKNARFWCKQVQMAEKEAKRYREQAKEAFNEYEFAACQASNYNYENAINQHYSFYWSSLQTTLPSVYSQVPTPVVKRKFDDDDPIGKVASQILERYAKALVKETPFHSVMKGVSKDYKIAGLGIPRVRVVNKPERATRVYFSPEELEQGMIAPEVAQQLTQDDSGIYMKQVLYPQTDDVEPELVSWDNYIHTPGARTPEQVWWRAFVDYYDKESFNDRFKDLDKKLRAKINFSYKSQGADEELDVSDNEEIETDGYAKVYEIWDIRNYKCYWVSLDCPYEFLDEEEDIYELKDFWPCATPIMGTTPTKSLYPIPDYSQLRHIVATMDFLANRIWRITKALKPEGVYDQDQPEIKRLVLETNDADIVPVENFTRLQEKGGIKAVIDWTDKSALAAALIQAYDAFDRQKALFFEISGYTDTMRGYGSPSESATQTATKDKYVVTRQSEDINRIQECARELLEKMIDLGLKVQDDETILQMAQVSFLDPTDQELIPQAMQMVRNDKLRTFQIDIETDSTVAQNSDIEKAARFELLQTVSDLVERIANVRAAVPELMPMVQNASLYAVRGMRQAAGLESSIEQSFEQMQQADEAAAENPEPDPEMMKMQMEQQNKERELAIQEQKLQIELLKEQNKSQELQLKYEEIAVDAEGKMLDSETKKDVAQLKATVDLLKANSQARPPEQ